MSETGGIDQNGGAVKEPSAELEIQADPDPVPADESSYISIMDDTCTLSDTDISMNPNYPLEINESQPAPSESNDDQVNKSTIESQDTVAKIEQEETSSQSRELKSLLALSKEANLDTNIPRKRKVLNLRKSRYSSVKVARIQYPVTAESELEMELPSGEGNKLETQEDETSPIALRPIKRKKSTLLDGSVDSLADDSPKRSRKSFSYEITLFKPNKDMFCWRCHKDGVNVACETCPRSYHQKCLKQIITDLDHWPCPECVSILKAESTQSRSPAMRGMTLEHLCSLLKFAVNRMIQCQGSEPFIHAVNDGEFPDYKKYIIQPMDLTLLEKNIKENLYGSTQAFEADAKWILHNSIIFNSYLELSLKSEANSSYGKKYQSKLTSVAKSIIKICKQEMSEVENCPSCYLNANTKKKTWFVEVCPKPHLLVWAKLRGFPFWPGKAMSCKDGMVDVRFFGAHDRAWVPEKECFLYSPKDPNLFRVKRADIEQCVDELLIHVENLKKIYAEFTYPPFKTPLDPDNELKQLQMFLPRYKSSFNKKRHSLDKDESKSQETNKKEKKPKRSNADDEAMEGYGTDDESVPEIDTELRKTLFKKSKRNVEKDSQEADEDDTQVPTNIEPDPSGLEEIVLSKNRLKFLSGQKKFVSEPSSKRSSFDDTLPSLIKVRRNSETKAESARINRVLISDDMEISLGNDDKSIVSCSSSNSECSSDFTVEIKKKPVQVDVDNVEFTISPASKMKISDKLIKRLSDVESGEEERSDKVEQAKRSLHSDPVTSTGQTQEIASCNPEVDEVSGDSSKSSSGNINWTCEETFPKTGGPKIVLKAVRSKDKLDSVGTSIEEESGVKEVPATLEGDDQEENSNSEKSDEDKNSTEEESPSNTSPLREPLKENLENQEDQTAAKIDDSGASHSKEIDKDVPENAEYCKSAQTSQEKNDETNVPTEPDPKANPEPKKNSKRKKSIEFDESALETQNKVLKLVSIESIMNKANNNQGVENSILKISLQAKNVPVSPDEIKSEPESEAESNLEAKKKYLSALNILEKGEADAQKPKTNEIRTRSKTEEKRERFRVSKEPQIVDNMTKIIEDVAINYSAVHEGEALPTTKNKTLIPTTTTKSDGCEIYVKSFAKIVQDTQPEGRTVMLPGLGPKQRARKSFPQPNYNKPVVRPSPQPVIVSKEQPVVTTAATSTIVLATSESISRLTGRVTITTASSTGLVPSLTQTQATKTTVPPLQQIESIRPTNGYLILQPPQQDNLVFLPTSQNITYSSPIASQVMSVTPCLVSAPTHPSTIRHLHPPQIWHPTTPTAADKDGLNVSESQNYIPQGEKPSNAPSSVPAANSTIVRSTASNGNRKLVNGLPELALVSSALETSNNNNNSTSATSAETASTDSPTVAESPQHVEPAVVAENGDGEEFSVLNNLMPENVTRAVTEIIRRPPPKLKPRPPGPLSQQFNEGLPSSAGPVTAKINSVAHRLGDYFRGMLIETLEDIGKTTNAEATISNLKLEIETLKHKHSIEMSEIEKNMSTVLKDIQQSIIDDRERIIEQTRVSCEAETIKRVEEAKSKQWCANCSKEAQFYCCWNTSYCDYPCQQKHWPNHMAKCTQNVNQPAQITPSATIRPGSQQLILRPANPPSKGSIGRVFTKPLQKVYMNRNVTTPKTMRVQTSAGSLLTMMETTPGNYQLVTSNAVVRTAGPPLASIKTAGLVTAANASITTSTVQKSGQSKQPLRVLGHSLPVTTVIGDESD